MIFGFNIRRIFFRRRKDIKSIYLIDYFIEYRLCVKFWLGIEDLRDELDVVFISER